MIQGTYTLQVSVNKLAVIKTLKWREFLQSNWVSLPATLIDINDATRDRFQSVVLPWTSLSFNKMLFPNWIYYLLFSFKRIFSWILINAWLLMLHNSLMTCSQILTLDKCSTPQLPSKRVILEHSSQVHLLQKRYHWLETQTQTYVVQEKTIERNFF